MAVQISEIIESKVQQLSDTELEQWRNAVEVERRKRRLGQKSQTVQEYSYDKEALYQAVCQQVAKTVRDKGRRDTPFFVFMRQHGAELNKCFEHLQDMEERVVEGRLRRPERTQLYRLYAAIVCRWLASMPDPPPISERVVLQVHKRFASILDRYYPGYGMTKAGWELLVKSKTLAEAARV